MQSSTTTTTFTHPRRTDALGHYRNRPHEPALTRADARSNLFQLVSKPLEPATSKDFYLDTLFNPVWMSGPHVFSFAKDGTVVRPETYRTEPYPGYRASVASSSGRHVYGAGAGAGVGAVPSSSPPFPRSPVSKASKRMDKPWKNVAITEQDDAEFAAIDAEAEARAQAEAKGKLMGLVYTWPPKPQPAACAECEVLAGPRQREVVGTGTGTVARVGAGTGTQASAVPALSYGSSGESESESEVFKVVPGRRVVGRRKEVPLEKSVGFGRRWRKAEGEGESGWNRCGAPREVGKVGGDRFSSPFMPERWVEDELTVRLKAILRIPDV